MPTYPRIAPAGDAAFLVEFGDRIDPAVGARVRLLDEALRARPLPGQVETACAFASLYVGFDPRVCPWPLMRARLWRRVRAMPAVREAARPARVLTVPVCYGGAYGPDLPAVAAHTGLTPQEVVRRHAAPVYRIYMLGFLPGFAYLGGLDAALETPRLQTPRTAIPAGAVGIGGNQTGIYPLASPGGWQLIGRTPLRPYDPARNPPILYRAGDGVRFAPVTARGFEAVREAVQAGTWQPSWREGEEA